ncbi:uncharacterized protein BDZ99DRAFT_569433 [Mytilinidion resinicola]|uniref:Uncharacterized protein n=1 Tax=Mytilinidion resinicola TaxID=574789 RepID=A0A6A6YTX6_9PEZI|nr:uncharacterized protein BDZ99DRAFT_569433 [Mytilinidion resinicola]KAF2811367.1 hypothetical protein BDZ99DRAFT_569433 [Mytilinidion resinicola]
MAPQRKAAAEAAKALAALNAGRLRPTYGVPQPRQPTPSPPLTPKSLKLIRKARKPRTRETARQKKTRMAKTWARRCANAAARAQQKQQGDEEDDAKKESQIEGRGDRAAFREYTRAKSARILEARTAARRAARAAKANPKKAVGCKAIDQEIKFFHHDFFS